MIELKTLKDFKQCDVCEGEGYEEDGLCCNKKDIRQEVVKWAKREIENIIKSESEKKILGHIGRFQVLCEIANLTEEDLNGKK